MAFMQKLENNIVFRGLLNVQNVILIITTILAGGVVFAGVVLRYVMQSNFFGQEEIIAVIAMWMYWVGGIYGSYENSHIKGDMLSSFFKSAKAKKIIELIIQVVSFVVILVFCMWGVEYMSFNLKFSAVSTGLKIPMAWSQWPLLLGFIFMELYTVFNFFRVLLDKDFGKEPPEITEEEAA
ncbi:MAG: TRAP transporter small permease subunit [Ruminiclostridium sp.]|nr:TRAP transporter small permease subunit [Ruminiclostridium sp.]